MKNLIKFSIVMAVLCITACTQTFENTSNEVQKKAQGRLVMKVGNESRTIKPAIGESDVKTAVLTANGEEIKSWTDDNIISQIQSTEDILLDVGNYAFTMTFYNAEKEAILTATTSKDIVTGDNILKFDMKPVTTGTGDISIILTWDVASGINKITAGLYDISTNEPLADFGDSKLEITISDDETQTPTATYSPSGVPVGQYIIKFKIYECETYEKLLNTLSEVINVAAGITTSTQITLSKINRQYTISYNPNGGIWTDNFIQTEYRNANEKIILPTANDITREDYEFGGWYDDENKKISEIPSDTMENIYVTAKWFNAICTVSDISDKIAGLSGAEVYDVAVTGELTSETISGIKTALNSNSNVQVNLDLSETTGLDTLPYEAFKSCKNLTSIILPDSVEVISYYAFSGCTGLVSIQIPNSVKSIEGYVFFGCTNLTSIQIPNSVETIGQAAFRETGLLSIELPNSITVIDDYLFQKCASLESITIPSTITSINQYAFSGAGLKEVSIPNSVTSIAPGAFNNCDNLTKVELPTGLGEIRYDTFRDCDSLTKVVIPNNVTRINDSAFYGCDSLEKVTIPDSVTTIGISAFFGCTGLTSVTIGNSVTFIDGSAFGNCSSLTTVNYKGTKDQWKQISINDGNSKLTDATINYNAIIVTASDVSDAISGLGEGSYTIIVTEAIEDTTISDINTALQNNSKAMVNLDLSGTTGLTSIVDSAFEGSDNLTSVTIPDSVTTISDHAFEYCNNLTSVTIGNGVKKIGYQAFYCCSSLRTVNYKGTEDEWNKITGINQFVNATINCNYTGE